MSELHPTLHLEQPRSAERVAGIATRAPPFGGGSRQTSRHAKIVEGVCHPSGEAGPLRQQGFVSDFHRRRFIGGVLVKGEQSLPAETLQDHRHRRLITHQVHSRYTTSDKLSFVCHDDRLEENALDLVTETFLHRGEHLLDTSCQSARDATCPLVIGDGERVAATSDEGIGEGELE